MSKAVEEQVNQLFEATKDLTSYEEIAIHCERFNTWLNENTSYSKGSLGTVLSRAGFYKKFKSVPLMQGKNADAVPKHDKLGAVVGNELKHYVVLLCGLDKDGWKERNESERIIGRLGGNQQIDPDSYLEVTGRLLDSAKPHEVAVGLIAATGRRPHEIIARAKFTAIDEESYQLMFAGQGKKRGDKPVFQIACLYPASYIIERLNYLRKEQSNKALLTEVARDFPGDLVAQNRSIDSRRNGSLNRVVRDFFGDKEDRNPVLQFRYDEEQDNCKALRAAYLALATERDCQGSIGSKMLYAARLAGHFVKENPTDRDLSSFITTLGYADYSVVKPVPFPTVSEKEKAALVRAFLSDVEIIKQLQSEWNAPNQQSVISKLVERYQNSLDVAKKLLESQSRIAQLEAEISQLRQENQDMEISNQLVSLDSPEFELKVSQLVEKALQGHSISPITTEVKNTNQSIPALKEAVNWEAVSDEELWKSKVRGASFEKVRRSFNAICLYNDTVANSEAERLAVTNQALRDLSGVNGMTVKDWIVAHKDEIIGHNSKYSMGNKKDPSKVETYYNKGKDTASILSQINTEFLSGEGLRSQSGD